MVDKVIREKTEYESRFDFSIVKYITICVLLLLWTILQFVTILIAYVKLLLKRLRPLLFIY